MNEKALADLTHFERQVDEFKLTIDVQKQAITDKDF